MNYKHKLIKWIEKYQETLNKNVMYNKISKNIGNQLYINSNYDETTIRYKINEIIIKVMIMSILLLIICILLYGINFYMFLIYSFVTLIVIKIIVDNSINKGNKNVLIQLPELINEIKSSYYENKMVTEALYMSIKNVPYEISLKAMEMYEILSSQNTKLSVEKYNREGNNTYLKMLMNILYLTKEYGDKKKNEKSIFVLNLNYLLEEVNIEIQKEKLVKIKLRGLMFSALFPLVFINFIEKWSISNFAMLSKFYDSSIGFIIKNVIIFITLLVIVLILNIQNTSKENNSINYDEDSIEKICKNKNFKILLKLVKPKENTMTYNNMLMLMEKALVKEDINRVYLRKIVFASLGFLLSSIMCVRASFFKIENIVLFRSVCIGIIVLITTICYLIPNILMNSRKKFVKEKAQIEVNKFNMIILLLMNYERVSIELIFEYMEKFSQIYRNNIKRCRLNFEKNREKALENFKIEADDKALKRLIRNLILCSKNIKIAEAFEFLETERNFYKDELKIMNEKTVNEKYNLAKIIGYVPYYTLIMLYFVLPIIYTSIVELMNMINQIKNI